MSVHRSRELEGSRTLEYISFCLKKFVALNFIPTGLTVNLILNIIGIY